MNKKNKKIKGIILAGGMGTRLYPLTKVTNKHLLPVGGEPMIHYPINKLVEAGIDDIMIVTGVEHCGSIISLLGSGEKYGCSFTYKVQDKPDGIAGALKLCKTFVGDDLCAVILGDNIFKENLKSAVDKFLVAEEDCRIFLKRVSNPGRYGVVTLKDDKIIRIDEKPEKPASNFISVGIYFYSSEVFNVIDDVSPSNRGEYEITEVNNVFVKRDSCKYTLLNKRWADAGTMDSYHVTSNLVYCEEG